MIYRYKYPIKRTLMQKIFGRFPEANTITEINNLLAKNEADLKKLSKSDILDVADKYNVDISRKFQEERVELFRIYLKYALDDKKLAVQELEILRHIKNLLFLTDSQMQSILRKETEEVFSEEVQRAVEDGELDNFEKRNLDTIKKNLLISDDIAERILKKSSKQILQNFINNVIEDERLSPEEENEITKIAQNLNVDIELDNQTKRNLEKFRLFWQLENGKLPTIEPDIHIQKSERLYFKAEVNWFEQRKVTKRINYGGPIARIRIAKGLYYRVGSLNIHRVSEDVLKKIDTGLLYLTNKRLIFMGNSGNKAIRLNRILTVIPYKNGVEIQKDAGKSPFLEFDNNIDIFSMILTRLLNDSNI